MHMTPAQAEIHRTTDASHWSKRFAQLPEWMNQISTPVPTIDTTTLTFQRATFMSSESAASVAEYRLRMFVATGPCMTRNSTGIENDPNAAVTKSAGSLATPALAMVAPRMPSHTVG